MTDYSFPFLDKIIYKCFSEFKFDCEINLNNYIKGFCSLYMDYNFSNIYFPTVSINSKNTQQQTSQINGVLS